MISSAMSHDDQTEQAFEKLAEQRRWKTDLL